MTFGPFADALVKDLTKGFHNAVHRAQWEMTLGPAYCAVIRDKRLDEITTDDILAVLKPIWTQKAETASRLRGRLERVLDAARVKGLRTGENPARWKGHLDTLLPRRQKLQRGHHAALPYGEMPAFMGSLKERDAVAARALEFAILTVSRSGEVIGATWAEIDLEAAVWVIPASRMKMKREHRVPLCDGALAILSRMAALRPEGDKGAAHVFPGQRPKHPLSNMAMSMLLRDMKLKSKVTVHGFRSTFRDWGLEMTDFSEEMIEISMSHEHGNATERAYRRGDALEKRRKLMAAWEAFCAGGASVEG